MVVDFCIKVFCFLKEIFTNCWVFMTASVVITLVFLIGQPSTSKDVLILYLVWFLSALVEFAIIPWVRSNHKQKTKD